MPLLFIFITLSIFCSALFTYFEYIEPSEQTDALNNGHQYKQHIVYLKSEENALNHSNVTGIINIGSVHSATSTIRSVLCRSFDIVICAKPPEFPYFNDRKELLYINLFSRNPSTELLRNKSLITLGNWSMNIEHILSEYPFTEFIDNWDLDYLLRRTNIRQYVQNIHKKDRASYLSKYILYGKFTGHYYHPPTAIVFSHMAYHRKWKFTLHIREPITRLWSVQQHWHPYDGTPAEIRRDAADDIWDTYRDEVDLRNIVFALKDSNVSNEYIIGLYYRLYFNTIRNMNNLSNKAKSKKLRIRKPRNQYAFEMTASLYCVHVMFWLQHFEKYFDSQGVAEHFRILQYEYITRDIQQTAALIYCWFREKSNDIDTCTEGNNFEYDVNIGKIRAASDHLWSVEMSWKDREQFIAIYRPCNQRLNEMVEEKGIALGEWTDYNQLYDDEMKMDHAGDAVVDHPERNTKVMNEHEEIMKENILKLQQRNGRVYKNKALVDKMKRRQKERKQSKMSNIYGTKLNIRH